MQINRIKTVKNNNYTVINNKIIFEQKISAKAKGIFLTIMALPENWEFSVNGLVSIVKESKQAIYAIINELIIHGYAERERVVNEKGQVILWQYKFFENPQVENPQVENPQVENPQVENHTQLSKNKINTLSNKINTQLNTKEKRKNIKKEKINSFESFPIPRPDVDENLWIAFLDMRATKLKKPLTEFGYKNLLSDLTKLPDFDLNRRISDAIDRNWQGLIFKNDFNEVKTNGNSKTNFSQNTNNGNGNQTTKGNDSERLKRHIESINANVKSVMS